jgi:hypothetical protein
MQILRSQKYLPQVREPWTVVLFAFIVAVIVAKCRHLDFPNFIFTYPFITYDGFQWITDSNHYLDRSIDAVHRNPGLPLTFALLKLFDAVDIFPQLLGVLTVVLFAGIYWLARAFVGPGPARLTTFWFFAVFKLHSFIDYVLSDQWCVTAIVLGLGCLVRAKENPKLIFGAAAAFGLALNYQFAPGFMAPALIWYVFRGIGWKWIKDHRGVVLGAVALFLALALPQFIYKWIAFGSPLYSHVIHFPLLRFHLFGIPSYFVGFFTFLGWPLAVMVFLGFKKIFKEPAPEVQLIHATMVCMYVFWILFYLWLDIRFLLYFLPMWVVYGAIAIERFSIIPKLSFRSKTIMQRVTIVVAVYLSLSLAAFKEGAFASNYIALTPQMVIRFSTQPITIWGVAALTTNSITTEHADTDEALMAFFRYIRFYRKLEVNETNLKFAKETKELSKIFHERTSSDERMGFLGPAIQTHENKNRVFDVVRRNIKDCDSTTRWCVAMIDDLKIAAKTDWTVQYRGDVVALLERQQ